MPKTDEFHARNTSVYYGFEKRNLHFFGTEETYIAKFIHSEDWFNILEKLNDLNFNLTEVEYKHFKIEQ